MADTAEDRHRVLLELHARAAAVPQAAARERVLHVLRRDRDPGRQSLNDSCERGAVRLPRCQPAHHGVQSLTHGAPRRHV